MTLSGSAHGEAIRPFQIDIPEADLEALRRRLRRTRWPRELGENGDWSAGVSLAYMRDLVAYWLESYDWRAQERALNALPQFKFEIEGVPIHFVHVRGTGSQPMPLVVSHGWPCTFWDMAPILGPLTDPARHGGDAADAFDVVLVSLPGVAFSGPLTTPGTNHAVAADLEAKLMTKLGYGRFGAQGSDIGALVTAQLGIRHADRLIGLHLHAPVSGQAPYLMTDGQLAYGPGEEACEAQALAFLREGSAYLYTLRTRPQTLGFAMHNSPTGLAAWLIDARRAASRCEGDPGVTFSRDALITNAMLYWLTDTFITSAGYFYGARHGRPPPLQPSARESAPPAAVLQFLDDVLPCPRDWAERHFNLQRWRHVEGGPRVGPLEASGALITDLRDFFRPLRGRRVNQSPGRDA